MGRKLFDSELKIMQILWKEGTVTAKYIAEKMKSTVGWSKTTTYTLIKRCIEKGAIERREPNFLCISLINKEDVQKVESNELVNKLYDGIPDQLISCLLKQDKGLKEEDIDRLMKLINDCEKEI